jgi:hypothetical protein
MKITEQIQLFFQHSVTDCRSHPKFKSFRYGTSKIFEELGNYCLIGSHMLFQGKKFLVYTSGINSFPIINTFPPKS